MNIKKTPYSNKGFTLIEMIIVLAILGIISAIATPKVIGCIDYAMKIKYISNCRSCVESTDFLLVESDNSADSVYFKSAIKEMAGVPGEINKIEFSDFNKLLHLTYLEDSTYVTYCAGYNNCINHTEAYTISDGNISMYNPYDIDDGRFRDDRAFCTNFIEYLNKYTNAKDDISFDSNNDNRIKLSKNFKEILESNNINIPEELDIKDCYAWGEKGDIEVAMYNYGTGGSDTKDYTYLVYSDGSIYKLDKENKPNTSGIPPRPDEKYRIDK